MTLVSVLRRLVTRPAGILWIAVAQASVGCGAETSVVFGAATRRVDTLELRLAEDAQPLAVQSRHLRLLADPNQPWEALDGAGRYRRQPGFKKSDQPLYEFLVSGGEAAGVRIPGPFQTSDFNTVAIEVVCRKQARFSLDALDDSGRRHSVTGVVAAASDEPQVLLFDLSGAGWKGKQLESLRLTSRSNSSRLALRTIDLLQSPAVLSFPALANPALFDWGGEMRNTVGLGAGHPIESQTRVQAGAVLRFSYLQPPHLLNQPGAYIELSLNGSAGNGQVHSYTLALGGDGDGEPSWREVRVPLAEFEGQSLRLRWEMVGGATTACGIAEASILTGAGQPRRVVLVTSDTHRADHLGQAGLGVRVQTPNLDALANRGLTFESCFTSTNTTNPSHIALMTATSPRDVGILNNHEPLASSAATLAEAFRAAGFATYASVSSRHLSHHGSGLGQGFDRMAQPAKPRPIDAHEALEPLLRWLDGSENVPVFVWLHVFDAHGPYDAPTRYLKPYYPGLEPAAYDESLPELEGESVGALGQYPRLRDLEFPRASYRAEITYLDDQLGRFFDHPVLRNAVVAFTADHGESLGQHGVYYAHQGLYPDSLHVPLILSYPGAEGGARTSTPVRQIDVGRTLLDLAGEAQATFPGKNLLLEVEQVEHDPRFAISAHGRQASVTAEGWHFILCLKEPQSGQKTLEDEVEAVHSAQLFDLHRDPETRHDLLAQEHAKAGELRRALVGWLRAREDKGWRGDLVVDEETLRQIASLGYTAATAEELEDVEFFPSSCDCEHCALFRD